MLGTAAHIVVVFRAWIEVINITLVFTKYFGFIFHKISFIFSEKTILLFNRCHEHQMSIYNAERELIHHSLYHRGQENKIILLFTSKL